MRKIDKAIQIFRFTSKVCFFSAFCCIVLWTVTTPLWIWLVVEDKIFCTMVAIAIGSIDLGFGSAAVTIFLDWWKMRVEEDDYEQF